jgi:hypothetical protein
MLCQRVKSLCLRGFQHWQVNRLRSLRQAALRPYAIQEDPRSSGTVQPAGRTCRLLLAQSMRLAREQCALPHLDCPVACALIDGVLRYDLIAEGTWFRRTRLLVYGIAGVDA